MRRTRRGSVSCQLVRSRLFLQDPRPWGRLTQPHCRKRGFVGYLMACPFVLEGILVMNALASDLDRMLDRLDGETAVLLEQTVRDALALAERRASFAEATDTLGYPAGYFEATAGSFADEPLEAPADLPLEAREPW